MMFIRLPSRNLSRRARPTAIAVLAIMVFLVGFGEDSTALAQEQREKKVSHWKTDWAEASD